MTKKRRLEYTVNLPDHTQRVFSTKHEIHKALGISAWKIDKSLRDDRDADISKLENRIEDLEAQIEKMKCCENCKHHYIALDDTTSCKLLDRFASSKPCDKWEIKEK